MAKQRQPATEYFQKLITALLVLIIGALGTGVLLMMDIREELGGIRATQEAQGKEAEVVARRVDRLEGYHLSRFPKRETRISPPIEVIPQDRRKFRLEAGR